MRYFLYARKSTDDGHRQQCSIDDQLMEVRALAAKLKLEIVDECVEKQSAKYPGRPIFGAMIERLNKGEAQGIMAWHPDRLARNAVDGGTIIYMVDTGAIKDLKFCTCPFETNAHGKFSLSMMFSQSKYYVDNLAENIRRGKRNRIKNGYWPSSAPMGYINDRGSRTLSIDPINGPLVQEMFRLYATGEYTFRQLYERLVGRGFRPVRGGGLSQTRIQHALRNPFYYGVLRFHGEFYEGKHPPLISQELFDQCRQVMVDRGRHKKPKIERFTWSGLVECGECGCGITMETQKGHRYYRCTKKRGRCSQGYVREDRFMVQVRDALRIAGVGEALCESLLTKLDLQAAELARLSQDEREQLQATVASCDTRIHRLLELYMEQGISVEEFRASKNRLVEERHKAVQTLEALSSKSDRWLEPAKRHVTDALHATCIANSGSDLEAAKKFKNIGSNLTLRDRRLQWQPRGAWQLLVGQRVVEMGVTGASAEERERSARAREKEREWSRGESNPRGIAVFFRGVRGLPTCAQRPAQRATQTPRSTLRPG